MANTSLSLTSLDFNAIKQSFKGYLSQQDRFKDYDFDASNLSVILEILSYNTFLNAFYLNMIGGEMFIDSAQKRDSVVSHAKHLNYTPASYTSPIAYVDITLFPSSNVSSVTIPERTSFTSRVASRNFTFTTNESIVLTQGKTSNGQLSYTANNVSIYEGVWTSDTFVYSAKDPQRFLLSNPTVDINSLSVTILEDNQATSIEYTRAYTLLGLNSNSPVYFLQGAENYQYEIVFGDGVISRAPKDNSIIVVQYRICSGELGNGASEFVSDGVIDGVSNIVITTRQKASGGSVAEDIDSIRLNAPRAFQTQQRAITVEDYRSLLIGNFPEVNAVHVYGGEQLVPAQYGKVFVAIDLVDSDGLSQGAKDRYVDYLRQRCPIGIEPVVIESEYTYIAIDSDVYYDRKITKLSFTDIRSIVLSAIETYNAAYLNDFNTSLRVSRLSGAIDSAQRAISYNNTTVKAYKVLPYSVGAITSLIVDFGFPFATLLSDLPSNSATIESTVFLSGRTECVLTDNGKGELLLVSPKDRNTVVQRNVGTVDYALGRLNINQLYVQSIQGSKLKVYVVPLDGDVSVASNTILSILPEDVTVNVYSDQ